MAQRLAMTPSLSAPEGLLLDAMGTLIGLRQTVGQSYAALAEAHGVSVNAAAIDAVFPQIYRQAPPLAFPGLQGEELRDAERLWWCSRIAEAFRACGHEAALPAELGPALFDHFAQPSCWRVFADVEAPLRRWQSRGIQLAVVSNFDQRLQGVLDGLGLAELFAAVVVSSAAGAAKPDPRPFQQALKRLGLDPHQAWHVGDSPEDEVGAKAAGLRCLLIRRPQPGKTS